MYECFEVTIDDNVAHIRLIRPEKRNSITTEFWEELPKIVADIDNNSKEDKNTLDIEEEPKILDYFSHHLYSIDRNELMRKVCKRTF